MELLIPKVSVDIIYNGNPDSTVERRGIEKTISDRINLKLKNAIQDNVGRMVSWDIKYQSNSYKGFSRMESNPLVILEITVTPRLPDYSIDN